MLFYACWQGAPLAVLPDTESVLGPCESSGGTFIASQLHLLDLDRFHTSSPLRSPKDEFIVPVDVIYMYNTACVLKLLL